MEWLPINWNLAKHPLNYFTVFFMVLIPLIIVTLLAEKLAPSP